MTNNKHPCADGITPACFKAYPKWARMAFCYKLLFAVCPGEITRRLPKGLFPGRIGPGAELPAGWVPDPGIVIPPDFIFPLWWIPFTYIILPPGLNWKQAFPAGWKAGDPLPRGVRLKPGTSLPTGWTPQNPPPSLIAPVGVPEQITTPTGALPPNFMAAWEPGPIKPRSITTPPENGYSFEEPFDDLTTNSWSVSVVENGTGAISGGKLLLTSPDDDSYVFVNRTDARGLPTKYTATFKQKITNYEEGGDLRVALANDLYYLELSLAPPNDLKIYNGVDFTTIATASLSGTENIWRLVVKNGNLKVYRDDVLAVASFSLPLLSGYSGWMEINANWTLTATMDYLNIEN